LFRNAQYKINAYFIKFSVIFEKIDIDGNQLLEESELEQWISYVEMRFVYEDTDLKLPRFDINQDGFIMKDEIRNVKYNPERIYNDYG
jgi:Ca2+-binding EF-hand superfamily protein